MERRVMATLAECMDSILNIAGKIQVDTSDNESQKSRIIIIMAATNK